MRASYKFCTAVMSLACLAAIGCGSSDGRLAIRGTATIDGQPLSNASVNFSPVGHEAPTGGTSVVDGKFHIPAAHGLLPGRYTVRFEAFRPTGRKVESPEVGLIDEVVFIEITEVQPAEVTVDADAANAFDFHLQSEK